MKKNHNLIIFNDTTGKIIGDKIKYAGSFFLRLKGLLFCKSLSPGEGLFLDPCSSVHSFGMKIIIDVVFLDEKFRVLKIVPQMKANQVVSQKRARYVLELKEGTISKLGISVGDTLKVLC
ncbi:MAG: DUF192 domain-containing protein [Bacillota bacterium]|jgi:uncharacterized membrane protein (UPF0127 family)